MVGTMGSASVDFRRWELELPVSGRRHVIAWSASHVARRLLSTVLALIRRAGAVAKTDTVYSGIAAGPSWNLVGSPNIDAPEWLRSRDPGTRESAI
jgi:hypothetical protein